MLDLTFIALLLLDADHNPFWEAIRAGGGGLIAGGLGLRVASAFVRSMPHPEPGERWYGWLYDFLQALCDNQDLKGKRIPSEKVQASAQNPTAN